MTDRTAHVIVSDDLRIEVGGKYLIVGMYTGTIGIPTVPFAVGRLVFTFLIASPIDKRPSSLKLEVTLPESEPVTLDVPVEVSGAITPPPEAKRWIFRIPLFAHNINLRPGAARARVLFDGKEEIPAIGIPLVAVLGQTAPAEIHVDVPAA